MGLNPAQEEAIRNAGIQLILAGPGSGKTRVITEKVLHLLGEGVPPQEILALTFSDKAAQEMRDRLEQKTDISDLSVHTFHSFCLQVLQDNVLDSGISFTSGVISRTNQLVWGLKNLDSFGFEHIEVGNNAVDLIEALIDGISAFRDELVSPDDLERYLGEKEAGPADAKTLDYRNKLRDLLKVYRAYERYKRSGMLLDYDDMIHEACDLFGKKPLVLQHYRDRYRYLLVDEFQDTNYAQLQLVKLLAGGHLCVVADDDQTIYRFRGAYLTNIQDYKTTYPDHCEILLDYNYRSSGTILRLALQLMENAPNRKKKPLVTENPPGDPVTVAVCENEQAEAEYVLDGIQALLASTFLPWDQETERPYRYSDIAILCRRRADGVKFFRLLRQRGIPCEFVGEVDFFASPAIRDLVAYLRVLANPLTAGISLNRIMKRAGVPETVVQKINTRARSIAWKEEGGNDGVFEAMQQAETVVPPHHHPVAGVLATLQALLQRKEEVTLPELVRDLMMKATGLYPHALRDGEGQTRLLLTKFLEIAREYGEIVPQATVPDFLGYLDLLSGFSVEVEEREETDSVKVLTVHRSKGKEFPVVFVADMATHRFPLRYQSKPFSVPNDLSRGLKTGDDERSLFEQEERRLCYVAMTRAGHRLTFTLAQWYGENKNPTKPSKFLEELDYRNNPLIRVVEVPRSEGAVAGETEGPVQALKRSLQDRIGLAVQQMQVSTAVRHLMDLEKIRLLEEGKSLDTFDPAAFIPSPGDDAEILRLFQGKRLPLIGADHRFSASSLQAYEECPLRYKFQHVLLVPTLPKTYFDLGSAVHSVIEHLSKQQMEGTPPTKELARALLEKSWSPKAYHSRTQEAEDRVKAEALLDTYLAWQIENRNEIVGVEKRFQTTIAGRTVKGFIDRIEKTPEGGYVVIDFKTGSKPSDLTKNTIPENLQMNVYSLTVQQLFGSVPERASLFYLKEGKMVDYHPTAESMADFRSRIEGLISQICAEEFEARPSDRVCRRCDFGEVCGEREGD